MAAMTIPQALQRAMQLHQSGRLREAEQVYTQILAHQPGHPQATQYLGVLASQLHQHERAIELISTSLRSDPGNIDILFNLARAYQGAGKKIEAAGVYQQVLNKDPQSVDAINNLAAILKELGRLDESLAMYRRAIAIKPDYAEAHSNMGAVLRASGRIDDAIFAYRQALALQPRSSVTHMNMGHALGYKGMMREAMVEFRLAVACDPNNVESHSSLLFAEHFAPDFDPQVLREDLRQFDVKFALPLAGQIKPHGNSRQPDRRLKIGYVSPDFRNHCQAFFTFPLLSHHDHREFEIICYSDVSHPTEMTHTLKNLADGWRDISGQTDAQVAELIRADGVDILVDLTMHMSAPRLLVFARKPAPVQVTWLAYPGSTGVSAIDYRLSDPFLDPPGCDESLYIEKTFRLRDTFWCFDPLEARDVPVGPLPAIKNGFVTFSCLNNFNKVNPEILQLWAKVMQQVPASRLLLLAPEGDHRQRTAQLFAERGVDAGRISFTTHRPRDEYLRLYHQCDIGLDSYPYNGHTTSLDSFWMGVPVVTLVGRHPVARAGWCQLNHLHLSDLAGHSPDEFVGIAVNLANDLPRLERIRAALQQSMLASPLTDAPRFARAMENAYRTMWKRYCAQPASV